MKFSLNPTFRPSSCFTHQYKNSTQFRLYASLIASQNTKQEKILAIGPNKSSYIHIIPNIAPHKAVELRPDSKEEFVWLVFAKYPSTGSTHLLSLGRDGKVVSIYGDTLSVEKYPSDSNYMEGYVKLNFKSQYYHVIIFGSGLSKIMTVD